MKEPTSLAASFFGYVEALSRAKAPAIPSPPAAPDHAVTGRTPSRTPAGSSQALPSAARAGTPPSLPPPAVGRPAAMAVLRDRAGVGPGAGAVDPVEADGPADQHLPDETRVDVPLPLPPPPPPPPSHEAAAWPMSTDDQAALWAAVTAAPQLPRSRSFMQMGDAISACSSAAGSTRSRVRPSFFPKPSQLNDGALGMAMATSTSLAAAAAAVDGESRARRRPEGAPAFAALPASALRTTGWIDSASPRSGVSASLSTLTPAAAAHAPSEGRSHHAAGDMTLAGSHRPHARSVSMLSLAREHGRGAAMMHPSARRDERDGDADGADADAAPPIDLDMDLDVDLNDDDGATDDDDDDDDDGSGMMLGVDDGPDLMAPNPQWRRQLLDQRLQRSNSTSSMYVTRLIPQTPAPESPQDHLEVLKLVAVGIRQCIHADPAALDGVAADPSLPRLDRLSYEPLGWAMPAWLESPAPSYTQHTPRETGETHSASMHTDGDVAMPPVRWLQAWDPDLAQVASRFSCESTVAVDSLEPTACVTAKTTATAAVHGATPYMPPLPAPTAMAMPRRPWEALSDTSLKESVSKETEFDDAVSDASAHVDPEELLSEDRHPLPNGLVYGDRVPTPSEILNVLFRLFKAADLTADVGIITLIYLERLVERAQLRLRPRTWLRALLICVITASKVWDDNAVWNADYHLIFAQLPIAYLNQLETWYLKVNAWHINVSRRDYTERYFALLPLLRPASRVWVTRPMTTRPPNEAIRLLSAARRALFASADELAADSDASAASDGDGSDPSALLTPGMALGSAAAARRHAALDGSLTSLGRPSKSRGPTPRGSQDALPVERVLSRSDALSTASSALSVAPSSRCDGGGGDHGASGAAALRLSHRRVGRRRADSDSFYLFSERLPLVVLP